MSSTTRLLEMFIPASNIKVNLSSPSPMSLSGGWVTSTLDTEATSTCLSVATTDTTTTSAPSSPRSSPCVVSGTCSSTREDASPSPLPASEWHLLGTGCCCSHYSPLSFLFFKHLPSPILSWISTINAPSQRKDRMRANTLDNLNWLFMVLKNKHVVKNLKPPWLDYLYLCCRKKPSLILVVMSLKYLAEHKYTLYLYVLSCDNIIFVAYLKS